MADISPLFPVGFSGERPLLFLCTCTSYLIRMNWKWFLIKLNDLQRCFVAMKFQRFAARLQDHDSKSQCPTVWGQSSLAKYLSAATPRPSWNPEKITPKQKPFSDIVSVLGRTGGTSEKQTVRFGVSHLNSWKWKQSTLICTLFSTRISQLQIWNGEKQNPEWNWEPCRTRSNGSCSHKGRTTWPVEIWAMMCLVWNCPWQTCKRGTTCNDFLVECCRNVSHPHLATNCTMRKVWCAAHVASAVL